HNFSKGKIIDRKSRVDDIYYLKKLNLKEIEIPREDKEKILETSNRVLKIDFSNLPTGIIHNDIFPDNVFVKDEKIIGILDFNDATSAPFIFDIAIIINFWIKINNFDFKKEKEYIDIFLNSYETIRKLSFEEKKLLDMGILKMALIFILLRIDRLIVRKEENILIENKSYKNLMTLLKNNN
ncbi:MAG: phosphotransferase, partial [Fusobacterium sp.]|nr:phosphotransferase [Fusobacterium sp.]